MSRRLFILAFVVAAALAAVSQVVMQMALVAPMDDASFVGSHLNQYDIEARAASAHRLQRGASDAGLPKKALFLKSIEELGEAHGRGATLSNGEARALYVTILDEAKKGFAAWLEAHMAKLTPAATKAGSSKAKKDTKDSDDEDATLVPPIAVDPAQREAALEHAAVLCSVARSRTRRYVRERMADRSSAAMLFARDAWAHGIRHLPAAIMGDLTSAAGRFLGLSGSDEASTKGKGKKGRKSPSSSLTAAGGGIATGVPAADDSSSDSAAAVSKVGATFSSAAACMAADDHTPCPSFAYLRSVRGKDSKAVLKSCFSSNEFYNKYFLREGEAEEEAHHVTSAASETE